jgi:nitrogen fixation/metabolism regulation signal transduction histidine kinase
MWAIGQPNKIVTSISLAVLWMIEVLYLIRYINTTNKNLLLFLQSFHFKDSSLTFYKNRKLPFKPIYNEFNRIIDLFNQLKTEKEIEHQYFDYVIKHVDTGLLAWDSNNQVKLFNMAAKQLLNIPHIGNLSGLRSIMKDMPEKLENLKPGRQELLKILRGDELISLYVSVSEFTISGEKIKLASFQNIHSELEVSESEAWQKLIKVLTHEIVNSVSPMKLVSSSLLKTISKSEDKDQLIFTSEELENMQSGLNAIYNRSLGLSKFVDDYKTITDIPKPEFEEVMVSELFDELLDLLKGSLLNKSIKMNVKIDPGDLRIFMDKKMIAQVLINLLKNSTLAVSDNSNPKINLASGLLHDRTIIMIEDNGYGIPFNMLDYVFMPFFTTRKDGSGIGLTLSRQIMKAHNGFITLVSHEGEGTKVTLIF